MESGRLKKELLEFFDFDSEKSVSYGRRYSKLLLQGVRSPSTAHMISRILEWMGT